MQVVSSTKALLELAESFAPLLCSGDVVTLTGGLGAGKTTFVRGLVRRLLGTDPVTSPTFTFRHRYAGVSGAIEHLDLYRIGDPAEAVELGLEDALDGAAIVLIEWPDRLPALAPDPAYRITIAGSGEEPREVRIARG